MPAINSPNNPFWKGLWVFITAGLLGGCLEHGVRLMSDEGYLKFRKHCQQHPIPFYPCYSLGTFLNLVPSQARGWLVGVLEDAAFKLGEQFMGEKLWEYPVYFVKVGNSSLVTSLFFSLLIKMAGKMYSIKPPAIGLQLKPKLAITYEPGKFC